jgi:hypothetical protein
MDKISFVRKVIMSCKNEEQLEVAEQWANKQASNDNEAFEVDMALFARIEEIKALDKIYEELPW